MNVEENWREKLQPVLKIKVEEFCHLGYDAVTEDDIWNYVMQNGKQTEIEKPRRLHQLTSEILRLSVNDILNRLRVESLQTSDFFSELRRKNETRD